MTKAPNKSKGPRPKHIPQRTCIACRRVDPKRALVRVVRDAEGRVAIDTTGKRAGRGAYLCHTPACWDLAIRRRGLERALRIDSLPVEDRTALERYAESLDPAELDASVSSEI
ncbi:MAG: YlxR family protein [Roseiflexaceae bacterium]|nr:YlxR family protein [Roseiflexaceae bacterium]